MARTAVLGRLTWQAATVVGVRDETASARTLTLAVPGWPGHLAGQHVDVRLTAPDGYTATRAYSIASPAEGSGEDTIELTVGLVPDGEVSSYLVRDAAPATSLEVRGPLGGWFVWRPQQADPVQLIGGGTGLVPLMAMVRTHAAARSPCPMRLIYSVRDPASVLYQAELGRRIQTQERLEVSVHFTRIAPEGSPASSGRIGAADLDALTFGPAAQPTCYVCGPTPFVEAVSDLLVAAGHSSQRVRAERFGPSGG
jgi:ferredoxin-NADP reductase